MKKNIKLVLALMLSIMMVMGMTSAMAGSKLTPNDTDTGSITIKNSTGTVSVANRTFRAYKILNVASHAGGSAGWDNIAYSVPAYMMPFFSNNTLSGLNLTIPAGVSTTVPSAAFDNLVTAALSAMTPNDGAAITAFAEKAQAWCKDNVDYYEATGTADASQVVFEHLPLGYYIVDDQTAAADATNGNHISAVILDTTNPTPEIIVKATTTTSDKSITGFNTGEEGETNVQSRQLYVKDEGEDQWKVSDVSFGDILHYQVDSKVPDVRGYKNYKFVMHDTLGKGLKLDKSTIKVTIGSDEYTVTSGDLEVTTEPETPTGAAATTLKIVLKNALAKFTKEGVSAGDAIAITYDVELTPDALVGEVPNMNEVYIDYSNNPKDEGTGDDFGQDEPHGSTPHNKTKTFVTEISIKKVDENGKPLQGAEFTMTGTSAHKVMVYDEEYVEDSTTGTFWKLKDGSYTTDDPTTVNPEATGEPKFDLSKYDGYTESDGLAQAANYKKYKLEKKTSTQIDENTVTNHEVKKITGKDGVITFTGLSEGTYHFVESGVPEGYNGIDPFDIVITFAYSGDIDTGTGTFSSSSTGVTKEADGTFVITVQNNKGVELPSTGGIGTTIFYVAGSILVLAAAILLITKRRMSTND